MMRQRRDLEGRQQLVMVSSTAKVDGMNAAILHGCIRLIVLFSNNAIDYVTTSS